MKRADLALYAAKSAGRNRVVVWNPEMVGLFNTGDMEIDKVKTLQRRIVGLSEKAETIFMESIWSLVQALEAKDEHAWRHSEHVVHYATGIAQAMGLGPKHVELIRRAAMIHDIGKIGVPDAILCKPSPLTPHERKIVEQHPLIAVRILEKMSFLEREIAIIRHHHEKWNGQGYPDGLSRTAIPLGARILAVADTFDALTATRPYHPAREVTDALDILRDSASYEFALQIVEAMMVYVQTTAETLGMSVEQLTTDDLLGVSHEAKASDTEQKLAFVDCS
jgi:putative nucleotidyltransferase with HDIG domain